MKKALLLLIAILIPASAAVFYFLVWRGTPITHDNWNGPVVSCSYPGIEQGGDGFPEMLTYNNCGTIGIDGGLRIEKPLLERISFVEEEPSCILASGRSFYVDRSGRTSEAYFYDFGCDYFSEGLARSPTSQGTRFIDKTLNVVIATPYQYALPFEDGMAVVCNDLRHRQELFDEHWEYVGGRCGYINKKGVLIVPMRYPMDDVTAHRPDTK